MRAPSAQVPVSAGRIFLCYAGIIGGFGGTTTSRARIKSDLLQTTLPACILFIVEKESPGDDGLQLSMRAESG